MDPPLTNLLAATISLPILKLLYILSKILKFKKSSAGYTITHSELLIKKPCLIAEHGPLLGFLINLISKLNS